MRERVGKRGAGEEPEPQNPTKLQIPTFFLHFPPRNEKPPADCPIRTLADYPISRLIRRPCLVCEWLGDGVSNNRAAIGR